jgi:hypothetical protein
MFVDFRPDLAMRQCQDERKGGIFRRSVAKRFAKITRRDAGESALPPHFSTFPRRRLCASAKIAD